MAENLPDRCPYCGGALIRDQHTGELVCSSCGAVIEPHVIDEGKEWRVDEGDKGERYRRTGAPLSPRFTDYGISVEIEKRGSGRLRLAHLTTASAESRTIAPALKRIRELCDALNLPSRVAERAAQLYRTAAAAGLVKGRSIEGMAAAVVFTAARQEGMPVMLDDLASVSGIGRKEIGKSARVLFKRLKIRVPPPPPPEEFVTRIAGALGLPETAAIRAREIIMAARRGGLSVIGAPIGYAAAAVYMACQELGYEITQRGVARAAGVTEVTVRSKYEELLRRRLAAGGPV